MLQKSLAVALMASTMAYGLELEQIVSDLVTCVKDGDDWLEIESAQEDVEELLGLDFERFDLTYCVYYTYETLWVEKTLVYKLKVRTSQSKYLHMLAYKVDIDNYENFYIDCAMPDRTTFEPFYC